MVAVAHQAQCIVSLVRAGGVPQRVPHGQSPTGCPEATAHRALPCSLGRGPGDRAETALAHSEVLTVTCHQTGGCRAHRDRARLRAGGGPPGLRTWAWARQGPRWAGRFGRRCCDTVAQGSDRRDVGHRRLWAITGLSRGDVRPRLPRGTGGQDALRLGAGSASR